MAGADDTDDRGPHSETFDLVDRGRAFVRAIEAGTARRDWERVMREMRGALNQLGASELVQSDRIASRLYMAIAAAADMEELDFLVDQLAHRVQAIIAERAAAAGEDAPPPAPASRTTARGEAFRPAPTGAPEEPGPGSRRSRTVLRL